MSRIALTLFSGQLSQAELQALVDQMIKTLILEHGQIVAVTQEVSNSK